MGVYAATTLKPGCEVGDYIGELLGSDAVRKRREAHADDSFRFEVGDDTGDDAVVSPALVSLHSAGGCSGQNVGSWTL